MKSLAAVVVFAGLLVLASAQNPEASAARFFDDRVEPILRTRCLGCHNDELKGSDVSFLDRDGLLKGGKRGPTIVPGKPDASILIAAVRQDGELKMPPGAKLSPEDIATLTHWVELGATWGTKLRSKRMELWAFERIDEIGGHATKILGRPRVIDTPVGRAVEFNGLDGALFIDIHPLAGAETFTWEVVFRPDPGGAAEQRFFHLQERDGNTGLDTTNRLLFEIRTIAGNWFLDSFAMSGAASRALINRERLHPLGAWYHAAMVYDGREFRNYVDGVLEGAAQLQLAPHGPGRCSVGVRINRRDYFKGAIRLSRMTRGALSPAEFLRVEDLRNGSVPSLPGDQSRTPERD